MTRLAIFLIGVGLSTGARAHPGHLATAGGHDHWNLLGGLAVLAVAVGVGVAIWAGRRV